MFKQLILVPALIAFAGFFMGSDVALARGPGGHGGGHGGGGFAHGGGHGGFAHGGYGHGGYGHGGYGLGYGLGGWGWGYGGDYPYSYGGYYGGYAAPYVYDAYPSVTPPASYYSPPAAYAAQAVPDNTGTVEVILPDPQARVSFDGTNTTQTGTVRFFHTPAMTPGGTYQYQIHATWSQGGHEMSQDRTVAVTPNQTAIVDFRQPASESVTTTIPGG